MTAISPVPFQDKDDDCVQKNGAGPTVRFVSIKRVRLSLKGLRGGCKPIAERPVALSDLPLRVVETDDGFYEVVDGFKRLDRWQKSGSKQVPVVLEKRFSSVEEKVALLEANRPPRTLTPMDEALVVHALRFEEGLGPHSC